MRRHHPYEVPERYRPNIDPQATGDFIGNMARHTWDYWNEEGDFSRPAKWKKQDVEKMEADSTSGNQIEAPPTAQSLTSSMGSNVGFRGRFVGNTQTNYGYEKHYQERQMAYSKKLISMKYHWGLSNFGRKVRGETPPTLKWGTSGVGGWASPGIICVRSSTFYGQNNTQGQTPFTHWGTNMIGTNMSENIYSNALNLFLGDFLDNKLFSDDGKKGIFLSYNKFRLKSFTVHLKFRDIPQNITHTCNYICHNGRNNNGWQTTLTAEQKTEFQKTRLQDSTNNACNGYFVYRDIYNTYVNEKNIIPDIPNSALAVSGNTDDVHKREQYVIKNLDSNLTYVKKGEEFSFTREINAQGNYYLTKEGIKANLKTPIGTIIANLEGQVVDGSSIVKKLPEGFNLLIAPDECDIEYYGELTLGGASPETAIGNGYILFPNLSTTIHMKTTAQWECFDFNYSGIDVIQSFSDPLEKALLDYNMERTIEIGMINRNGGSKEN